MLNRDLMIQILFWAALVVIMVTCTLVVFGVGHDL